MRYILLIAAFLCATSVRAANEFDLHIVSTSITPAGGGQYAITATANLATNDGLATSNVMVHGTVTINSVLRDDDVVTFPNPGSASGCASSGSCGGNNCNCSGGGTQTCAVVNTNGDCLCSGCGGGKNFGGFVVSLNSGDTIQFTIDAGADAAEVNELNNRVTIIW